jgi:hypothetical protein
MLGSSPWDCGCPGKMTQTESTYPLSTSQSIIRSACPPHYIPLHSDLIPITSTCLVRYLNMRSALLISALAALALAAPRPQDIEFDLVDEASTPEPTTAPDDGQADVVDIQPTNIADSIGAAAPTSMSRRNVDDFVKRDGNCSPLPAGTGPAVV